MADQDQVDTQIVVTVGGIGFVIGTFVVGNGLLEMINSFLRSLEKPAGSGHICVNPTQQKRSGPIADEFESLLQILEAGFVISLLDVGHADAEVRFRQATPTARLTKIFQRLLRIIAGDWIFADAAVDTRQGGVNMAQIGVWSL